MRVIGNVSPSMISIENYRPLPGYVQVRFRENIKEVNTSDNRIHKEISFFEYDEYTFVLRERENLQRDIEKNIADWLITGKTLEVNELASIVQDMKQALEIMGVYE